jgi:type II secretory pathway pseudopilin PulG
MINKRILIAIAVLILAPTTFAQFNQSNRLDDLASRLSREANSFADSSYRSYSNSFRNNRSDIEGVMIAEQFSGAAQVFSKMVNDRRRNQELRDAFAVLQNLARSVDSTNPQRNAWNSIQRLLTDIGRELDQDSSGGNQYPDQGRSGRITWRGRVDDDVRITVRGGRADVETIGGTPYSNAQPNFTASLPPRRVNVKLTVRKSRGEVFLEQQPSRENDYAVVVRIKDPKGGASDYEFELSW